MPKHLDKLGPEMKFTEHRDSNINAVKSYQKGQVRINADTYEKSLFLTQTEVFSNWQITDIQALDKTLLKPILEQKPEVIILGTGEVQTFPDFSLFAYCREHGVGLEVMANDAACRTFNILTTEDRPVILALIMEELN